MLISHSKRFIFFHLPKNAGSSVEKALRQYSNYPVERIYNYMVDYLGQRAALNLFSRHITPYELQMLKSAGWMQRYVKFAVVRNSWDWHVSQYHYHIQNGDAVFHKLFRELSFSEYIAWATKPEN